MDFQETLDMEVELTLEGQIQLCRKCLEHVADWFPEDLIVVGVNILPPIRSFIMPKTKNLRAEVFKRMLSRVPFTMHRNGRQDIGYDKNLMPKRFVVESMVDKRTSKSSGTRDPDYVREVPLRWRQSAMLPVHNFSGVDSSLETRDGICAYSKQKVPLGFSSVKGIRSLVFHFGRLHCMLFRH